MSATLTGAPAPALRARDGRLLPMELERWLSAADEVDEALLDRAQGPVLDVGCGPGRLVQALCARGVEALGVDVSASAVAVARQRCVPVVWQSVFDPLPDEGRWASALLVDGSVGIGGDPGRLLRRVGAILRPGGRLLIEAEPPGERTERLTVRIESAGGHGPWFHWARVAAADLPALARRAGFAVTARWAHTRRHFAELRLA